jgi:hypothetical protein
VVANVFVFFTPMPERAKPRDEVTSVAPP